MTTDPRAVLSRPAPAPDATLRYGDHPDQVVDLRLPAGPAGGAPLPPVVVIHGGFWRSEYDRGHTGP
ncbi:alpha/beta hydrolase, partial [Micromonospora zhanjiangensis]